VLVTTPKRLRAALTIALAAAILAPSGAAFASTPDAGDTGSLPAAVRADLAANGDLASLGSLTSGTGVSIDVLTKADDGSLAVQTISAGSRDQARAAVALLNEQGAVVAADLTVSATIDEVSAPAVSDELSQDYVPYQWGNTAIRADEVGTSLAAQYGDLTVAILDTGVANHADLANVAEPINANTNPVSPGVRTDSNGHGTHVAGTVSASFGNGAITGIAPGVRILPVKVFPDSGSGTSDAIARGIIAATAAGADVINMSLTMSGQNSAVQAAINAAHDAGIVVVAATGNSGAPCGGLYPAGKCGVNYISYPAAGANVIAVGATNEAQEKAVFSQAGVGIDLSAPGDGIYSLSPAAKGYGPVIGMSGTSMSTPHVAAVAALVKTANPALTTEQVEQVMTSTARDLGATGLDDSFGYGQVDARAAVDAALALANPTPPGNNPGPQTPAPVAVVTGVEATVGDVFGQQALTVTWDTHSADDASTEFVIEFDGNDQTQVAVTGEHKYVKLASLLTPGDHTVRVARYVGGPSTSAFSAPVSFNVPAPTSPNHAPVAVADSGDAVSDGTTHFYDVLANDTDADDDTLHLYDLGPTQHGSAGILNGKVAYTPALGFTGTETINYRVWDGQEIVTGTLTVTVTAPVVLDPDPAPQPPVVLPPVITPLPPVTNPTPVTPPVSNPAPVNPAPVTPPVVTPPVVTPPVVTPVPQVPGNPVANSDGSTSYTSPNGASVTIKGAIQEAYKAAGASKGILGVPTTGELTAPDRNGKYTHFQGGSIYWTAETGAHAIKGSISALWAKNGWEKGLGYPSSDEFAVKGGTVQRFTSGLVYTNASGTHEVHGAIESRYAAANWENGLGLPTTSEGTTPDRAGRFNHFAGTDGPASIYWSPSTGAQVVKGAIRGAWSAAGWENSRVGYPTGEEFSVKDNGRVQRFQNGLAYWSPTTGAHLVFGAFGSAFAAQGWENGSLGFPTSGEVKGADGKIRQTFQGGTLTWDGAKVTRS
jgi:subtilisin family serine protease